MSIFKELTYLEVRQSFRDVMTGWPDTLTGISVRKSAWRIWWREWDRPRNEILAPVNALWLPENTTHLSLPPK